MQENIVYQIASKYGGFNAGEESGKAGFTLTFAITYIRDLVAELRMVCESFETSAPWEHVSSLCTVINKSLVESAKKYGIPEDKTFISNRIT